MTLISPRGLLMTIVKDVEREDEDLDNPLFLRLMGIARAPIPQKAVEAIDDSTATSEVKPPRRGIHAKRRERAEQKRLLWEKKALRAKVEQET
ncbi:hypothetical protein PT974_03252 [Cladobotryum mycophilum]|uniref:Uncharacterized protein n=1 Tax=Cladobotryum mycophilum TaxID=491253 RepID=A0ABR0ST02_9HYPO